MRLNGKSLIAAAAVLGIGIGPAHAAFPGQNGKIAFNRGNDIWLMNADGSGQAALTAGGARFTPAMGPQGRQIAFERQGDIWVIGSDGSGEHSVTAALASTDKQPAWSPDGSRIAFSRFIQSAGGYRIWVVNADGSNPVQLTGLANPSSGDFSPAWSPDGSRIAYVSTRGSTDIYTVPVAQPGAEAEYVRSPNFTEDQPSWSPDGSAIAFTSNRGAGQANDIYEQAGAGGPGVMVAGTTADDHDPSWSPDGARIAFSSNRGGTPHIWTVGSAPVEQAPLDLTPSGLPADQPDWAQAGPVTLPPPAIGKTMNAAKVKGTVLVAVPVPARVKAKRKFVPLEDAQQIPVGSILDTSRGTVRLQLAASLSSATTQSGDFRGARFSTRQSSRNPLTELLLAGGNLNKCNTKRSSGGAARKRSRRLFSNVHGRFRTRGRNSTATVRGTQWTMTDTCAGTLTAVKSGTVVVRDLVKRKSVRLTAGQRYMARARRR